MYRSCKPIWLVEHDLETRLEWVAATHHDTAHRHTHVSSVGSIRRGVSSISRSTIGSRGYAAAQKNWRPISWAAMDGNGSDLDKRMAGLGDGAGPGGRSRIAGDGSKMEMIGVLVLQTLVFMAELAVLVALYRLM